MTLLNLFRICCFVLIILASGCAFKPLSDQEKSSADLMPASSALLILKRYNISQNNYLQESIICGGKRLVVPASELTEVVYFKSTKTIILRKRSFLCLTQGMIYNVYTEDDAREIVSALRAVGATKLDEIKVMGF
jgi:hypothetical protein